MNEIDTQTASTYSLDNHTDGRYALKYLLVIEWLQKQKYTNSRENEIETIIEDEEIIKSSIIANSHIMGDELREHDKDGRAQQN